jgi:hypothetical protein
MMRAISCTLWVLFLAALPACVGLPQETDDLPETTGPVLELSRTEIDFGDRVIQQQGAPIEVYLYNRGDEPLDVYTIRSLSADKGFTVRAIGDGFRIRAGSEGTFLASFRPSVVGPSAGMILIETNVSLGDGAIRMAVRGVGVAGELRVEPSEVEVAAEPATITLANEGKAALRVTAVSVSGDPGFVLDLLPETNGNLPFELDPRDPETGRPVRIVRVSYDGSAGDGTRTGILKFIAEDAADGEVEVPLLVRPAG